MDEQEWSDDAGRGAMCLACECHSLTVHLFPLLLPSTQRPRHTFLPSLPAHFSFHPLGARVPDVSEEDSSAESSPARGTKDRKDEGGWHLQRGLDTTAAPGQEAGAGELVEEAQVNKGGGYPAMVGAAVSRDERKRRRRRGQDIDTLVQIHVQPAPLSPSSNLR